MALHVTVEKGDKILLSDGVVIDVRRTGKQCQLSVEAPEDIRIIPVFADAKRQLKYGRTID